MRKFRQCVNKICDGTYIPPGFNSDQCRILVDVYNELRDTTRTFIKDRQVCGFIKKQFGFPCKEKGGIFVIWRNDLIWVVK